MDVYPLNSTIPASSVRWRRRSENITREREGRESEESEKQEEEELTERRKALFEPLEPKQRLSSESLLPPPDFDAASYPKGWLIGKKRKLVNVDVVESMRKIAIQEMNRKDREINCLNEQLEEDARVVEHVNLQLLQEKTKRVEVERENAMLKEQIGLLMDMIHEEEEHGDEEEEDRL